MSSVWVQLYHKGKDEPKGQPVEIEPIPKNAGALKAVVLPKLDPSELAEVFVYPPEAKPPFSEQIFIRGDKILKELIDELGNKNPRVYIGYDHPLIVVAPEPPQQLQPAVAMAMAKQVQKNLKDSVCLFVGDDEKESLGCGFAVSPGTVHTCAHHWQTENKSIGSEVKCYYGKTENNKLYTMHQD